MNRHLECLSCATVLLALAATAPALADQTVGLFTNEPETAPGYTLFSPMTYNETYLIDINGQLVHSWPVDEVASISLYLFDNGNLMQFGGGQVGLFDWDGTRLWRYVYSGTHHDIQPLPNGNVLIIARETKTDVEAFQAGRDPALLTTTELWSLHIIEVQPVGTDSGTIVWEWNVWDHLIQDFDPTKDNYGVVADHPELIDINYIRHTEVNWLHSNAINYNAELDQIVFNSRNLNEFLIIDHSTTTAEAAGHTVGNCGRGGDILYRWGNPQAYDRGTAADQKLFAQHDAQWIAEGLPGAGNILVFNNGNGRPEGAYSTVEEIVPPVEIDGCYIQPAAGVAYGPADPTWIYTADTPTDFYSSFISGTTRMPNGNTLICTGAWGELFEVETDGTVVWRYVNPVTDLGPLAQGDPIPTTGRGNTNRVFRVRHYPPEHGAFAGRDLTPGGPLEIVTCPGDVDCDDVVDVFDLLALLSAWGEWSYADFSGNGAVEVLDLIELLAAWGACP